MIDSSISSTSSSLRQWLGGRNLYLVGMMGSGKSCTGPYLAKELDYSFVDTDKVIEKASGQSISLIFEQDGEKAFRDIESQVLSAIGQRHSLVVATGGGLVTRSENWGILHQGIVIWLDPGLDRLLLRLKSDPGDRPLLNNDDPLGALESLFIQREKFYLEADLHLQVVNEDPAAVAKLILNSLPSILRDSEGPNALQTTAR